MKAGLTAPTFQLYWYPGRDHAFAREGGKHFHPDDALRANQRTMDFFARGLS
jgi:carboxymethylenebutenolidase